MPIQPRAPTRRENSRSKPPHERARLTGLAPLNCSARNARTSSRSDSASGGRSRSAKRNVGMRPTLQHSALCYTPAPASEVDVMLQAGIAAVVVLVTLVLPLAAPAGAQTDDVE